MFLPRTFVTAILSFSQSSQQAISTQRLFSSASCLPWFIRNGHHLHRPHHHSTRQSFISVRAMSDNPPETKQQQKRPCIDSSETVGKTKWLELKTCTYTDQENKQRQWDYVTRTTKHSKQAVDAAIIVPLLKRYNNNDKKNNSDDPSSDNVLDTILVEQFRPPVGQATLEFPAGLIDKDETPEQAALRELREETGYVGEACKMPPTISRPVCMSPGLCDETVQVVVVMVDLDNPYNQNPQAQPDAGEHITLHRVSLKDGFQTLLDQGSSPMAIQGLYLFALGLELGKSITK